MLLFYQVAVVYPKTGPCRAAFPRWYFNSTLNECIEFVYGGCDGNENNFKTKKNCTETCKASADPQQGWYIVSFFVFATVNRHVYAIVSQVKFIVHCLDLFLEEKARRRYPVHVQQLLFPLIPDIKIRASDRVRKNLRNSMAF